MKFISTVIDFLCFKESAYVETRVPLRNALMKIILINAFNDFLKSESIKFIISINKHLSLSKLKLRCLFIKLLE